ncbi:TIGR02391 family protein [Streptomyces sp. NPDC058690]|uniref:TIGR02391 family protein n=1 Tax=Streptomyces sp. NPDC058690 TaxID=3346600 RepID=UPI0036626388
MIVRTIAPEGLPRPTGEEGHVLLDAIWSLFTERLVWPVFDDIDRALYGQGLEWESAVQQLCPALLRGLDPNVLHTPQADQQLSLTVAGAANCTESGPVLKAFLLMVRKAADIERTWRPPTPGATPELTNEDLKFVTSGTDLIGPSRRTAGAAMELGIQEPCFQGGGINPDELGWRLYFTRSIRPFAGVMNLQDYWRIRAQALGAERTEADLRPFSKREPEVMLQPPLFAEPAPAAVSPESMSVTCNLHPLIAEVAVERYNRGAYNDAVRSAFQAVEHRVQTLAGSSEIGERLMGIALNVKPGPPMLTVTRSTGGSLESEQTGMQFLFKGAMGALRNPRSHGPDEKDDRDEAEEMLVFASFLMRRLDIEDDKRKAGGPTS